MNSNLNTKPNLFIIGTAKAGTTAIHNYLNQHPEICMSTIKEPNWFGIKGTFKTIREEEVPHSKVRSINDYYKLFSSCKNAKIIGESSVSILYSSNGVEEINKTISGDCKIIIGLRDPVERAYSSYMHHRRDGLENLKFEEALEMSVERMESHYSWGYDYLNIGLYYNQIKRVYNHIQEQNIYIYLYDDFSKDPNGVLKDICEFLGVESEFSFDTNKKKNVSGELRKGTLKTFIIKRIIRPKSILKTLYRRLLPELVKKKMSLTLKGILLKKNLKKNKIDNELRVRLKEYFRDDLQKTEALINIDLSKWYRNE